MPSMNLKYFEIIKLLYNQQPGSPLICFVPRDICAKYEFKILIESRVIAQFACCHGSRVSISTRLSINMYCHKEYLCQIILVCNDVIKNFN